MPWGFQPLVAARWQTLKRGMTNWDEEEEDEEDDDDDDDWLVVDLPL